MLLIHLISCRSRWNSKKWFSEEESGSRYHGAGKTNVLGCSSVNFNTVNGFALALDRVGCS